MRKKMNIGIIGIGVVGKAVLLNSEKVRQLSLNDK